MKSIIIFLGPPGSGKGTHGDRLSKELGYNKISTGDILRESIRNKTTIGNKAKKFIDSGELVPDDIIINLIKEKISKTKGGIIFDGFPRTVEQADALSQYLDIDTVINFDMNDDEVISRLTKRRSCPKCNAVYHLIYNAPLRSKICDICGSELYQRDDDREETIRNRLAVYRDKTMPLIDYYNKKGLLVTVNGIGSIDKIFENIKELIQ